MDKGHRRLLMVEDNESYFIALKEALKRCGIPLKVDHIEDGDALMPYLKQGDKPDLILMDINMDRMSGLEALRKMLKKHMKTMPTHTSASPTMNKVLTGLSSPSTTSGSP